MFYFIQSCFNLYNSAAHWKMITIGLKRLKKTIVLCLIFVVEFIIDMNWIWFAEDTPPAKACILRDLLDKALDSFEVVLLVEQTTRIAETIPVSQIHVDSVTHEMVTAFCRFIHGAY